MILGKFDRMGTGREADIYKIPQGGCRDEKDDESI